MRFAAGGFSHETNSFALERNTEPEHFSVQVGQEIVERAHPKSFIGGFLEAARGAGADIAPTINIHPTNGGLLGARAFERYRDQLAGAIAEAHKQAPLDGIYLALHGAMTVEEPYVDGEGALLQAIRDAVGAVPIVATYDFHAIMSELECSLLAAAFPNDTNPHIDGYERGLEAGQCLVRIARGEISPVTRRVLVPVIGPNIGQSTWNPVDEAEERLPLWQLNEERAELERVDPHLLNVTILGGYGYADTPDTMMAVVATSDRDPELAERAAAFLAHRVWDRRQDILNVRPISSVDDGVRRAMQLTESLDRRDGPLILVDLGDDPGSATPADSPVVLEALLRLGAQDAAVTIRDVPAVAKCHQAGVGAELELEIGASID